MKIQKLKAIVQQIIAQARDLKDKHTYEKDAQVNYACIFSQNESEHQSFISAARGIGKILEDTPTGPLFLIEPLNSVAGPLRLLKIRFPDITRPELGDADFTIRNYAEFKKKYLEKEGFKLIVREKFEMIELKDTSFSVLAYFSNPPLDVQFKIK